MSGITKEKKEEIREEKLMNHMMSLIETGRMPENFLDNVILLYRKKMKIQDFFKLYKEYWEGLFHYNYPRGGLVCKKKSNKKIKGEEYDAILRSFSNSELDIVTENLAYYTLENLDLTCNLQFNIVYLKYCILIDIIYSKKNKQGGYETPKNKWVLQLNIT